MCITNNGHPRASGDPAHGAEFLDCSIRGDDGRSRFITAVTPYGETRH
jgi:hypothetical protein